MKDLARGTHSSPPTNLPACLPSCYPCASTKRSARCPFAVLRFFLLTRTPRTPFLQVLSIGETVEEVNDSGFLGTAPTLLVQLLADSGCVQVHPNGLRHIRPDRRVNEWKTPGKKEIVMAASNAYQVSCFRLALSTQFVRMWAATNSW